MIKKKKKKQIKIKQKLPKEMNSIIFVVDEGI